MRPPKRPSGNGDYAMLLSTIYLPVSVLWLPKTPWLAGKPRKKQIYFAITLLPVCLSVCVYVCFALFSNGWTCKRFTSTAYQRGIYIVTTDLKKKFMQSGNFRLCDLRSINFLRFADLPPNYFCRLKTSANPQIYNFFLTNVSLKCDHSNLRTSFGFWSV